MTHEEDAQKKADEQRQKLETVIAKEVELAKAEDALEQTVGNVVGKKEDGGDKPPADASIEKAIYG